MEAEVQQIKQQATDFMSAVSRDVRFRKIAPN